MSLTRWQGFGCKQPGRNYVGPNASNICSTFASLGFKRCAQLQKLLKFALMALSKIITLRLSSHNNQLLRSFLNTPPAKQARIRAPVQHRTKQIKNLITLQPARLQRTVLPFVAAGTGRRGEGRGFRCCPVPVISRYTHRNHTGFNFNGSLN